MIKELYFAVRIGDPKLHAPYLMLDPAPNVYTPALFRTRADAVTALNKQVAGRAECSVIGVEIRELKTKKNGRNN